MLVLFLRHVVVYMLWCPSLEKMLLFIWNSLLEQMVSFSNIFFINLYNVISILLSYVCFSQIYVLHVGLLVINFSGISLRLTNANWMLRKSLIKSVTRMILEPNYYDVTPTLSDTLMYQIERTTQTYRDFFFNYRALRSLLLETYPQFKVQLFNTKHKTFVSVKCYKTNNLVIFRGGFPSLF